ncbi:hypothetical protein FS837_004998 [Tulasnella sp. UAMH 9824]|nr:hypothetical protein FS837_004998 [Tulasnella sp. UAMH 9824]
MNRPTSDKTALKDMPDDTVPLLSSDSQQASSSSRMMKSPDKANASSPAGGTRRQPGKQEQKTIDALKKESTL